MAQGLEITHPEAPSRCGRRVIRAFVPSTPAIRHERDAPVLAPAGVSQAGGASGVETQGHVLASVVGTLCQGNDSSQLAVSDSIGYNLHASIDQLGRLLSRGLGDSASMLG